MSLCIENDYYYYWLNRLRRPFLSLDLIELVGDDKFSVRISLASLRAFDLKFTHQIIAENVSEEEEKSTDCIKLSYANRDILRLLSRLVTQIEMREKAELAQSANFALEPITVWKMLRFAQHYRSEVIVNRCLDYFANQITVQNCARLWQIFAADQAADADKDTARGGIKNRLRFIARLRQFICENFDEICKNSYIIEQLYRTIDSHELAAILDADRLPLTDERDVWLAIARWIELDDDDHRDDDQRRSQLPTLLRSLRYGRVSYDYLRETIAKHKSIRGSIRARTMIDRMIERYRAEQIRLSCSKATVGVALDANRLLTATEVREYRPRTPSNIMMLIGGWTASATHPLADVYDCCTGLWYEHEFSHLPAEMARAYFGMHTVTVVSKIDGTPLHHLLYLIGGTNGSEYLRTVICYDFAKRRSVFCAPMRSRRCFVSTAIIKVRFDNDNEDEDNEDKNDNRGRMSSTAMMIYALGGHNSRERLASCECYDVTRNRWRPIAPMNTVRSDAAAVALESNRMIVIAGGVNLDRTERSVERYDPRTDRWTAMPSMICARSSFALIEYHNSIYAIGGRSGSATDPILRSVERYDLRRGVWCEIAPLNAQRSTFKATIFNGRIYVMNGYDGVAAVKTVETYDSGKNVWTIVGENNRTRSAFAVITIDRLPNADYFTHNAGK